MTRFLLQSKFLFFCLCSSAGVFAQPAIQWDKTIGGIGGDNLRAMYPTADGGFIVAGTSISNIANEKSEDARERSADYWLVKVAIDGTIQWDKTYGGSGGDQLASAGMIVCGTQALDSKAPYYIREKHFMAQEIVPLRKSVPNPSSLAYILSK